MQGIAARGAKELFSWLNLDEKQKAKLENWILSLPIVAWGEETMEMSGPPYHITFFTSGIGEVFYIKRTIGNIVYTCYLSYDDDGKLFPDFTKEI